MIELVDKQEVQFWNYKFRLKIDGQFQLICLPAPAEYQCIDIHIASRLIDIHTSVVRSVCIDSLNKVKLYRPKETDPFFSFSLDNKKDKDFLMSLKIHPSQDPESLGSLKEISISRKLRAILEYVIEKENI